LSFCVYDGPAQSELACGYICGYGDFNLWVHPERGTKMELTDIAVRKLKAKHKPYKVSDGGGLFVWVTPSSGKLWRWSYRFKGKQKLMTFGKYPDVPLALARERHSEGRRTLAAGVDPMAKRKADKVAEQIASENSFAQVATRWLEHWREGKSPRHVDSTKRRLDANLFPALGSKPIACIEAPDLVTMVRAIEARGVRDIAKRALETSGQIFRYAIANGLTTRNPAAEIRPSDVLKPARKGNYARLDAKELPDLLRKIELYRGTQLTRLSMKLMALTFVRTGELIGARWSEIDFQAARWDIPAERMKMRTPHIVPLSTQALEVLGMLRELSGDRVWVFPGDRSLTRPMSNNTILKGLGRMGYKGRMTGHGFRGLASTILHEHGYRHEHIELQLAHAPRNAVSAAYNHALHLKARVEMMQDWADFLERSQRGAKVLDFREVVAQ
jgi:integrase